MCSPIDVACLATQTAATVFDSIAVSAGKAAAEMIGNAMTFWVGTETAAPDSPAVQHLQRYTVPISAVILTGSIMVQGIRMMLSRKKDPLIAVAVDLIRYAVETGVPREPFVQCLDGRRYASAVEADIAQARGLGIRSTPTFLINSQPVVGAQPIEVFRSAIDHALRAAGR